MLIPVVAIAPTTNVEQRPGCWSLAPDSFPIIERRLPNGVIETELAGWVKKIVDNNFDALLWTGLVAFVAALVIEVVVERRHPSFSESKLGRRASIAFAGAMLFLFWRLSETWSDFYTLAHGYAALAFFVFLALAIIANAVRHFFDHDNFWAGIYGGVASGMIVGGILIAVFDLGGDHDVLWLEGVEIALFAAYWLAQTVENWDERVLRSPTAGGVGSRRGDRDAWGAHSTRSNRSAIRSKSPHVGAGTCGPSPW
jgi:hypothetical protein